MKVYQKLAQKLAAIANCEESNNEIWLERHQNDIDLIMTMFPSGSGFDSGTNLEQLSEPFSTPEKLIFTTSYHHMDKHGFYNGWTDHVITVTPSLQFGFNIKVSGKNVNDIKNYIAECFEEILNKDITSLD